MGMLTRVAGVALAVLAWFNPLGLPFALCVALFILGFDLSGMLGKLALFAFIIFFPVSFGAEVGAFVIALFVMLVVELLLFAFELDRLYRLVLKPGAVFVAAYLALGLQPALIVAGVDLLANMLSKWKSRKAKTVYKARPRAKPAQQPQRKGK